MLYYWIHNIVLFYGHDTNIVCSVVFGDNIANVVINVCGNHRISIVIIDRYFDCAYNHRSHVRINVLLPRNIKDWTLYKGLSCKLFNTYFTRRSGTSQNLQYDVLYSSVFTRTIYVYKTSTITWTAWHSIHLTHEYDRLKRRFNQYLYFV